MTRSYTYVLYTRALSTLAIIALLMCAFLLVTEAALPLVEDEEYLALLAQHENDEQNLHSTDTVRMDIYTSHAYLAETTNNIAATFVGDFASSGPHILGSFPNRGAHSVVNVTLARKIGNLQGLCWFRSVTMACIVLLSLILFQVFTSKTTMDTTAGSSGISYAPYLTTISTTVQCMISTCLPSPG
jgi:hypothetical protein